MVDSSNSLCFFVTRCIRNETHSKYWRECVLCIRRFYSNPIFIIDDDSSFPNIDIENDEKEFENVKIIRSEFKGAGEILPYYYAWKIRPAQNIVILHDSMFLQDKIPIINLKMQFFWHFDEYLYNGYNLLELIKLLPIHFQDKIKNVYNNPKLWTGCFGVAGIATMDFIDLLFEKYELQKILSFVQSRDKRETLERLIAIIAYIEEPNLIQNPSIFGNIKNHVLAWGLNYDLYKKGSKQFQFLKLIKIWSGR